MRVPCGMCARAVVTCARAQRDGTCVVTCAVVGDVASAAGVLSAHVPLRDMGTSGVRGLGVLLDV